MFPEAFDVPRCLKPLSVCGNDQILWDWKDFRSQLVPSPRLPFPASFSPLSILKSPLQVGHHPTCILLATGNSVCLKAQGHLDGSMAFLPMN